MKGRKEIMKEGRVKGRKVERKERKELRMEGRTKEKLVCKEEGESGL